MEIKHNDLQPSGKEPADYFTGTIGITPPFKANDPGRKLRASVTFEPGAQATRHTHPLGQTSVVTVGCGLVQRKDVKANAITTEVMRTSSTMGKCEDHESGRLHRVARQGRSVASTLSILTMVFIVYLVIGIALPVLPLYVHQGLGFSTFVVGLVVGCQFAATLISRVWAGNHTDVRGVKHAVVIGLLVAVVSGLLYLLSLRFVSNPEISVTILLMGRALLGGAESFITIGALSWGIALMGSQNTGKVMAWIGMAMYAAYAVGAPAGTAIYTRHGFAAIALATMLVPLCTLLLVAPLQSVTPPPRTRLALSSVFDAIWVPGLGLALSSIGFGAITTFIALLFAELGWGMIWLAFTAFSIAFIMARLVFGHLPDKIGGARVALVCVLIEAAGQALIWLAPWPALALIGASLTGFGYSLVYPGFGVEAVRRVPEQGRALAMGVYTGCLDLALGVTSPVLGLIAHGAGLRSVYLASTLVVLCATVIAMRILYVPSHYSLRSGGMQNVNAEGICSGDTPVCPE